MGVKGLWEILYSKGVLDSNQVELSNLKGKILTVDVSIWLYQFVKSVPAGTDNAVSPIVIGGLFQRVCKLLHFGIKPIFVLDGAAPALKKETVTLRQDLRRKREMNYTMLAKKILKSKLKLMALEDISKNSGSNDKHFQRVNDEKLKKRQDPPIDFVPFLESPYESDENEETEYDFILNENSSEIDTSSLEFKKLPYEIQEQILLVSRKRTIDSAQLSENISDSHIPESPKKGDNALDFSKAQVEALIKRRKLMDELEALRGNIVKQASDSKIISHGKIASSSDKKYFFTKNAEAGWTLALSDSKVEDRKQNEDFSFFSKPIQSKEPSISDIDDDNEFMNMMFGPSSDLDKEPKCISVPSHSSKSVLSLQISDTSSEIEEDLTEFDLDIPTKMGSSLKNDFNEIFEVNEEYSDNLYKPCHSFISENTMKLPEIILEGLIKTSSEEISDKKAPDLIEPSIVNTFSSSTSSIDELDHEYNLFIDEISGTLDASSKRMDLKEIVDKLQNELRELNSISEKSSLASISPTKVLIDAFLEMLHHFRLPFVVAPFEAEAQCVFISDTDGVISDDSDCLLFGAQTVYKGFFGSGRKVSSSGVSIITIDRITEKLGLKRNDLIVLAYLLGCDYCTGITGIGPKKALELIRQVQTEDIFETLKSIQDLAQNDGSKYQKWLDGKIPCNFIDHRVAHAFLNPIVTPLSSKDMQWGSFDQDSLARFMSINAKWRKDKTLKYLHDIEKKNK